MNWQLMTLSLQGRLKVKKKKKNNTNFLSTYTKLRAAKLDLQTQPNHLSSYGKKRQVTPLRNGPKLRTFAQAQILKS